MSRVVRQAVGSAAVFIGEQQRDVEADKRAELRLGELFPRVNKITSADGSKLIPISEVAALEAVLTEEKQSSYQEGYTRGFESGKAEGLEEARKVIAQFQDAIFDTVRQRETLFEESRNKILELVLKISRKATFDAVEADRETTVGMIAGVIDQLVDRSRLKIKVHPSHLPIVEQHIDRFLGASTAIKELTFEPDPRVRFGGCFIETPTGDIDARLETQLDLIGDALLGTDTQA